MAAAVAGAEAETEPSPKCHVPSPIMLFWIGTGPEQLTERLPFQLTRIETDSEKWYQIGTMRIEAGGDCPKKP